MNIAVLGCGNMASAVVKNMHVKFPDINFFTYTPSYTKAKVLADETSSRAVKSLDDFPNIDYWLIGCKPQQVKALAKDLNGKLKGQKIVSMLAATKIDKLRELFDTDNIVRIMPNTPVKLGLGITLIYSENNCDKEFTSIVFNHNKSGSSVFEMKSEDELDELTVFSGSGPAYIFYLAQTLEQKLQSLNINKELSRKMINDLFVGSSAVIQNSSEDISVLIDQVTSKAGVTIEAVNTYKDSNLSKTTSNAIDAALKRTREIIEELK